MYTHDSLKFIINGHCSDDLWLTRGVKQGLTKKKAKTILLTLSLLLLGCNLSPLLFCLFINQLGQDLNSSGLGIDLGPINISYMCFADDIIIIGKNKHSLDVLMAKTQTFFKNHRLKISETKSKIMSYDSDTGHTTFQGSSDLPSLSLENVISFKYLGVPVSSSPRSLFKNYNEQVKKKARAYLASVLSLVKTGPDRSEMAHMLWTSIALPSILYGAEVVPLTQDTISEVEKCQSQVAKFALQIPRSSASVSANLDGGFCPVWATIAQKVILYSINTMKKPTSNWAKLALDDHLSLGSKSPYTRYLLKWKESTKCFGLSSKQIKATVKRAAISSIYKEQRLTCATTFAMNGPGNHSRWFSPKPWVNDSATSRIISQFRACNSQLGNRGPARNGEFYKLCPLCSRLGISALNNEVLLLVTPFITPENIFFHRFISYLTVLR